MPRAKLKTRYHLPLVGKLAKLHAKTFNEVQAFARWKSGDPRLTLADDPAMEALHDAYFLVKAGAIECEYTDCLPGDEGEGLVVGLNVGL